MPRIDAAAIPKAEMTALCAAVADAVKAFYRDPANVRAYKEWQKNNPRKNKEVNTKKCWK